MDGVVSSSSPTANEAGDIVVVVVCDEEISGLLDFSSSCDLEELLCNITASSTSASDSSSSAETLLYSTSEGDPAEDLVVRNSNRSFPHYNNTKMSDFMKVLEDYSSDEFRKNFRVKREVAQELVELYSASKFSKADHGGLQKIKPDKAIHAFLWFAGNKSGIKDVAGRFGMSESSFFRQFQKIINFFVSYAPKIIKFPSTAEGKEHLADEFKKTTNFPDVIGCIGGTYIPINAPAGKVRNLYVHGQDQIYMAAQAICDSKLRFLDVFTGEPCGRRGSRIFKLSLIYRRIQTICGEKFHILGDAAYPIAPFLLTPYRGSDSELTAIQTNYNRELCATRANIVNAFDLLKQRFLQLHHLHFRSVDKVSKFIMACCMLHNICIDAEDTEPFEDTLDATVTQPIEIFVHDGNVQTQETPETVSDADDIRPTETWLEDNFIPSKEERRLEKSAGEAKRERIAEEMFTQKEPASSIPQPLDVDIQPTTVDNVVATSSTSSPNEKLPEDDIAPPSRDLVSENNDAPVDMELYEKLMSTASRMLDARSQLWTTAETRVLLREYCSLFPKVKNFRVMRKCKMWKTIAKRVAEQCNTTEKTGEQTRTRLEYIMGALKKEVHENVKVSRLRGSLEEEVSLMDDDVEGHGNEKSKSVTPSNDCSNDIPPHGSVDEVDECEASSSAQKKTKSEAFMFKEFLNDYMASKRQEHDRRMKFYDLEKKKRKREMDERENEKKKRHQEIMDVLRKKVELEERKLELAEKLMQLKYGSEK